MIYKEKGFGICELYRLGLVEFSIFLQSKIRKIRKKCKKW